MKHLITAIAAGALLAACSNDSGDPDPNPDPDVDAGADTDAPVASTSCFDDPPTTAPDPLAVDGTVVSLLGSDPIDGALVEARMRADDSVIMDQTTGADGAFALDIGSGGTPWAGYFAVSRTGMFTSYVYFSGMVAESLTGEEVKLVDDGDINVLELLLGMSIDTNLGIAIIQITDCDGNPVAGAQVSLPGGGDVLYTDGDTPDPNATSTDASGGALGLNLPVGDAHVVINIGDVTVETTIRSEAQSFVGLIVQP